MAAEPDASVILYGSYARGDFNDESDIDVLILINKEKVTMDDRRRVSSSLNRLSLNTNILISPWVYTKKEWATQKVTPFYENVKREGIQL